MRHPVLTTSALLFLLPAACQQQTVEWGPAHAEPAEQRPTVWNATAKDRLGLPDMTPRAEGGKGSEGGKQFVATVPAGWEAQPAQPARFRDLVWRVAGDAATECYLTAARPVGSITANLDRWYKQFGIQEPAAVESLPVVEFGNKPGRLLELSGSYQGKPDQGMMLAFTVDGDVVSATLKFTGPTATVQAHREKFLELAKSLRAASASPVQGAPPIERGQQMPADHPPVASGATQDTELAPFTADVPQGWTAVAGSHRMLHHSFGEGGEVYVSQLGVGLRQNLDIWRGEMGLAPATDAEFDAIGKVPMLGGDGVLLELAGDYRSMSTKQIAGAKMMVIAQEQGGSITFAKLVGKAAEVEGQRTGFLRVCESLRRTP